MNRCLQLLVAFVVVVSANQSSFAQAYWHRSAPHYQAPHRVYRPATQTSKTSHTRTAYRIGPGDVLGILVEGVVGEFASARVNMPSGKDDTLPSIGDPFVVMNDGNLALPLIKPIRVNGMTISQTRQTIENAYLNGEILAKRNRVYVSLVRKRTVDISVIQSNPSPQLRSQSRGAGNVRLPADRANVITALAESGLYQKHAAVRVYQPKRGSNLSNGAVIYLRSPTYYRPPSYPWGYQR
jgi:hypothetical protein